MMVFKLDIVKVVKLQQLKAKGRTEAHLRHVLDQWGIKGLTQNRYIKQVLKK